MGINISAWHVLGVKTETDSYPTREYKYFDKKEVNGWDYLRYSGDRDFWMNDDLKWETRYEGDDESDHSFEETYHRPKDINEAIKWVKENIYEGNQDRWINLLEKMKTDNTIYLTASH